MEQLINDLKTFVIDAGIKLLWAILIVFIGFKVIKFIEKLLKNGKLFKKVDKTVKSFLISFVVVALKIFIVVIAATELGVPMTSVVTVVASASVAIGLALQGGLANLAGGIMILVFHPFQVGDYIEASSQSGTVHAISLFYTILTTIDNRRIMVPNGILTNETIINYSTLPERRIDINFDVSYDADIDMVTKVLTDIIKDEKKVIKKKDIFVRLTNQGTSSLTFTTRCWVKQEDYWDTKFNILEKVKKIFDEKKIEIPYNQLDVHLKK